MDFVCKVSTKNALSESFELEWIIQLTSTTSKLASQKFCSSLEGGVSFQVLVKKIDKSRNSCYNALRSMKVGLRKIDVKNCDIKALLFFEILNNAGELYLKEGLEKQFSKLSEEHFSDEFDFPSSNYEVQGRNGSIYFEGGKIRIKGKIFFQCCDEKKLPCPMSKNIIQLQADLKDLLQNKTYSDVKFRIGDEVLHAHKNILSSRSEIFKKMFEQNMKEKETSSVKISDIEKSVFDVFLSFLYTGKIQEKKLDVVMPLYSVADKYAVQTLLKTCSNILVGFISDTTVAPILKLADMHNDAPLKSIAVDFICNNFSKVEATESWDTLLNTDPRLASYVLKQVSTTIASRSISTKGDLTPVKNVAKMKLAYDHDYYDQSD